MNFKSLVPASVLALALPFVVGGCEDAANAISDVQSAACCTEPNAVAQSLPQNAQGQFLVTLEGVDALAAAAEASVTEVANACRAIAVDLGASATELDAGDKAASISATADAHCKLAASKLNGALGGTKLTIAFDPPACEASVSAKAQCEGRCDVDAKCDVNVTPPTCTGGQLVVECGGSCDLEPGKVEMECTGKCEASCTGSCTAEANVAVACDGVCRGTCSADAAGGGNGIQADGTCKGKCDGTCELRAGAKVTCEGKCDGSCTGKCSASATAPKVRCSGKCSATATPLECKGGKLEGGCNVKADCNASCEASVQARASCTPPVLTITGGDGVKAVVATLEKNLPVLISVLKVRAKNLAEASANVGASVQAVGTLDPKAAGCVISYAAKALKAGANVDAALKGSITVTGSVGIAQ
jgi:hypothetical protein